MKLLNGFYHYLKKNHNIKYSKFEKDIIVNQYLLKRAMKNQKKCYATTKGFSITNINNN